MRTSGEFQCAWRQGRRSHTRNFIVLVRPNQSGSARLGITVSGKVGHSVRRNQLKRWLREFFRHHLKPFHGGFDISIVAKRSAASMTHTQMDSELLALFSRLESGDYATKAGHQHH